MTADAREAAIRRVLEQVYDAGANGGRKPGKRGQVIDWAGMALLALLKPEAGADA